MNVIETKNVSKLFKVYQDKPLTLKDKLLSIVKKNYDEFHVLKNITLAIPKGKTVGLIGHNGCGKSTLLKLLTRIIYPEQGDIIIKGQVSSLLELGAGFHPDFTGRENIYTNAAIFGLSKKQTDLRLQKIIDFSELHDFIDNPVRTYSSGMYMRLAFSVAINVDPEILLIDEILAVGDANFQKKCLQEITSFKQKGVTIVLVSHDMSTIERICDRVIWLDGGTIKEDGSPKAVINSYLSHMMEAENDSFPASDEPDPQTESRWGDKRIEITSVLLHDKNNTKRNVFDSEAPLNITINYRINTPLSPFDSVAFGVAFFSGQNTLIYGTNTQLDGINHINLSPTGSITLSIPRLGLLPDTYRLDVAVHDFSGRPFDYIQGAASFGTSSSIRDQGVVRISHIWTI